MIVAARYDSPVVRDLLDALAEHYVSVYGAHDLDNDDPADYAPPDGGCLVGYEGGAPVVVGCWRRHGPGVCELRRFYVAPSARRRGLGPRLLVAVLEAAAAAGYESAVCATAAADVLLGVRGVEVRPIPAYGPHADLPGVSAFQVGGQLVGPSPCAPSGARAAMLQANG